MIDKPSACKKTCCNNGFITGSQKYNSCVTDCVSNNCNYESIFPPARSSERISRGGCGC